MKIDPIQQYKKLRKTLLSERERLCQRVAEIDATLSESDSTPAPIVAKRATTRSKSKPKAKVGGRRGNAVSLKQAVIQVLSKKPLTKNEILAAVQAAGYKFASKNPANSLGVILYGKDPKFKNNKGSFSLGTGAKAAKGKAKRARKPLSAEARAKIAAAQKKRWKKARKGSSSK